jgi:shikimate kinase
MAIVNPGTKLSDSSGAKRMPLQAAGVRISRWFCPSDKAISSMRLSLIAMSGSGKSYWAGQLAGIGFKGFSCDQMIASRLADELAQTDGSRMSMGKWMGLPYRQGYLERESKYLAHEKQVLEENNYSDPQSNIVIDTTGSVIYTSQEILNKLRKYTTVVHMETPPRIQNQMYQAYLARPRPVLWQGKFRKKPYEKNKEALARCYAELLAYRERLYKHHAHKTIDYDRYRKKEVNVIDFLREINSKKCLRRLKR